MVTYINAFNTLSVLFIMNGVRAHVPGSTQPDDAIWPIFKKESEGNYIDQFPYVAPGPDDLRGPCPFLNAMANHGIIDHSGRDLIAFDIPAKIAEAFDLLPMSFTRTMEMNKVLGTTHLAEDGETVLLNLDALWTRGNGERDASLVFQDAYLAGEDHRREFDQGLLDDLLSRNPGSDRLFAEDFAQFGFDRIIDSRVNNPEFNLVGCNEGNMANQYWLNLIVSDSMDINDGILKSDLEAFLKLNKLPDTYSPRYLKDPNFRKFLVGMWGEDIGFIFLQMNLELFNEARNADLSEYEDRRRTPAIAQGGLRGQGTHGNGVAPERRV